MKLKNKIGYFLEDNERILSEIVLLTLIIIILVFNVKTYNNTNKLQNQLKIMKNQPKMTEKCQKEHVFVKK